MRQGQKARQAKSKARIQAYNEMANQSEREKISRAQIVIPNGPRLGSKVIEVENLAKHMGDKQLIEDLSFSLPPGGIVGVIGPNGAGKSTLFKMLTGQEAPDSGTIELGDTVQLSYVDQSRDDLNPKDTVWESISGGAEIIELGDAQMNSRAYCSAFNFKGGDQQIRDTIHIKSRMLKEEQKLEIEFWFDIQLKPENSYIFGHLSNIRIYISLILDIQMHFWKSILAMKQS